MKPAAAHEMTTGPTERPSAGIVAWARRHPSLVTFAVIAAVTGLAYIPSYTGSFQFDDLDHIVNANVRYLTPGQLLARYPTRWLVFLSFKVNAMAHGLTTPGFHAVNTILHGLNAFLVYVLTRLLWTHLRNARPRAAIIGNGRWPALFVALVFALHPLQTQAVVYISQRVALAATLFILAGLVCVARGYLPGRSVVAGWVGAGVCGLAGLACKEIVVALPVLAIVMVWVCIRPPDFRKWGLKDWLAIGCAGGALVLFAGLLFVHLSGWNIRLMLTNLRSIGGPLTVHTPELNRWTYALTQTRVIPGYVALYLWPFGQEVDPDIPIVTSLWSLRVVLFTFWTAAIIACAVYLRNRVPLFMWGVCVFFFSILPQSSVIPTPDVMFEHRVYFGVAGLTWAVLGLWQWLRVSVRSLRPGYVTFSVALVLLPLLAALTFARCRVWKDELTLWADAIHKSPLKQRVAANYANALINRGHAAMAIAILESRLPVWDEVLPGIYALLGNAYAVEGNLERAVENYRIAASHNPSDANTRFNLASAYHALGQRAKAINVLRVSLRYSPTDADTYLLLGLIYAEQPADRAKALDALTTYLRMVPAGPDAETARETISRLQSATAD